MRLSRKTHSGVCTETASLLLVPWLFNGLEIFSSLYYNPSGSADPVISALMTKLWRLEHLVLAAISGKQNLKEEYLGCIG